jgi:hypothetical protein
MSPLVVEALSLTDQVQAAIDVGEWPRALELETERRRVLERLALAADAADVVATTFATLAERNYRLIGLVEHHKRRVLREAAVARTAHAGVVAYASSDDAHQPAA